jgi:hypothetical protein
MAAGIYQLCFANGDKEELEASKVEINGAWITFYDGSTPIALLSSTALERVVYPRKSDEPATVKAAAEAELPRALRR